MVGPEIFVAAASGAVGAFGGITKAHGNFQERLNRRFEKLEGELNNLKSTVIHDYVLKEDFLREMQAVHNKLDRILDYLIKTSNV
jgi:hypothetical protein